VTETHTDRLIGQLFALRLQDIPERTREQAANCLIDGVGCGLFGATRMWSRLLVEEMLEDRADGNCLVLGRPERLTPAGAALCNGTAIHAFEMDDLIAATVIHPAAAVIPAALATAESADADGATLLRGIVAGYEIMHRTALAIGRGPVNRGFHTTSLVAPIGAVMAAGIVRGLDFGQLRAAVGLAASAASGIKSFADGMGGGMVKRLHLGRGAEAGVRMAALAGRGFSGPPQALESRFGMLNIYGEDDADAARLDSGFGAGWAIDDVWFKAYPICGWIQAVVQLVTELRGPDPLPADAVGAVRVGVSAYAARNNGNPAPADVMGGQYSIPYCVAAALTGDVRDPAMFEEAVVTSPAMRRLAARVSLSIDPEIEASYPAKLGARVAIELANGESRTAMALDCRGGPADPLTRVEHREKFSILARGSVPDAGAKRFLDLAGDLDRLGSVRDLTATLHPETRDKEA